MGENATKLSSDASENGENDILRNWKNQPTLSVLLTIAVLYILAREVLQCISSLLHYATSPENYLELVLIALTFALLFGASREVAALAILLSTWELVILMAQHPRMSRDIEMFKTVTINFVKFLFLYIFLILAFALAFFVLFKGEDDFPNPFRSLFKTIVMLTGEFDSGELPFAGYPLLSRLIFVGFIFLIVIILLNLLTGLAVNDTGEILAEAELVCLVSRAQLVAYAERMAVGTPFVPRTQFCCCCVDYLPLRSFTSGPMRLLARRILLFPRYLPHATLSVKPLKSYEITLHGRQPTAKRKNKCSSLRMEPVVAQRAKEILAARGRQSSEDRIFAQLAKIGKRLDGLEPVIREVERALKNNNNNDDDNASGPDDTFTLAAD